MSFSWFFRRKHRSTETKRRKSLRGKAGCSHQVKNGNCVLFKIQFQDIEIFNLKIWYFIKKVDTLCLGLERDDRPCGPSHRGDPGRDVPSHQSLSAFTQVEARRIFADRLRK